MLSHFSLKKSKVENSNHQNIFSLIHCFFILILIFDSNLTGKPERARSRESCRWQWQQGKNQRRRFDSRTTPRKSRDSQGLVPVTVKMISEASQSGDDKSNFMINGLEIANVTLVGLVYNKEERASDVNFTVDDGTGRVACKRWASEVFDTRKMDAIQDGMYVRLMGNLKSFQASDGRFITEYSCPNQFKWILDRNSKPKL